MWHSLQTQCRVVSHSVEPVLQSASPTTGAYQSQSTGLGCEIPCAPWKNGGCVTWLFVDMTALGCCCCCLRHLALRLNAPPTSLQLVVVVAVVSRNWKPTLRCCEIAAIPSSRGWRMGYVPCHWRKITSGDVIINNWFIYLVSSRAGQSVELLLEIPRQRFNAG